MEELLAKSEDRLTFLSPGSHVIGKVTQKSAKSLSLDIGYKSSGVVSGEEFELVLDFIKSLSVGDSVAAVVTNPETAQGYTLLSVKESAWEYGWEVLSSALKNGKVLDVLVVGTGRGGLEVSFCGLSGTVPGFHLSSLTAFSFQDLFGKRLKVKVVEASKAIGRIVFSEKAVSEGATFEGKADILENVKKGDKFVGRVSKLVAFGAFVEIEKDGVPFSGLVHLSELSWDRGVAASDVVAVGEKHEVVVLDRPSLDVVTGEVRLALSIKQARQDPFSSLVGKYKTEQQVSGVITKVGSFGASVEIEPGLWGVIRSSSVPADRSLKEGESVLCFIENIDVAKRRLSLGLVLTKKPVGYK